MPDGSIRRALDDALQRGDLEAARSYSSQLPRGSVGLDHALAIVALLSLEEDDPVAGVYELTADRWLQLAGPERPELDVDELERILNAMPDWSAAVALQKTCEREGWAVALETLERYVLPQPL